MKIAIDYNMNGSSIQANKQYFENEDIDWIIDDDGTLTIWFGNDKMATYRTGTWFRVIRETE